MLDELDRRLLRLLQADPSRGVPDLAEAVSSTPARVTRRLDQLRAAGVLLGSRIVIDWRALGYAVAVSLRITLDKTQSRAFDDFLAAARQVPEVIEIQTFLGRVDVRLSLIARDLADYQRIYREQVLELPHIADIEALMTVATVKGDESLPL
ncbi:Lrp/AsnC family transcriptional regulator [Yoonia vestfoldensis]|jgi:Lrp/AsnC family transcriptional regulator|uniref:Transcriptional regulator, AsnC family n=1 Tax=Yoonia vestfoldensis SKA53 TaxID=314232 RepID=A3V841_9RHOB|nr:Lrp/AsnC family transcriptional regulator [Yoonia vestfoldensis]EAQ05841.1 transcriptional regulator, AsnC family [Yoonia vestfoldensis SKA53]